MMCYVVVKSQWSIPMCAWHACTLAQLLTTSRPFYGRTPAGTGRPETGKKTAMDVDELTAKEREPKRTT
ncbi:hypothetical protein E2562_003442 [Oryza meyeriana var. granulata]|uniref:Uncharacterized protein n=1 Tax=Oryza meyeriana var. granulata TaxID=110450 RepID=A0A6G1EGZ7_9ORYZ|nr:hypothetical protein E2562_003442 [Oryza meyeriana var. granulata]